MLNDLQEGVWEKVNLNYEYGLHDFMVDYSHIMGVNAAINGEYKLFKNIDNTFNFETFIEYDKDKKDPDHIPVWFQADYQSSKKLFVLNHSFNVNALFDLDWKMNTVSAIEQNLKAGLGLGLCYVSNNIEFNFGIYGGYYYLELDDDIPVSRGYQRKDLSKSFMPAIAYNSSIRFSVNNNISLFMEADCWYDENDWLEKSYLLKLEYKNPLLFDHATLIVSAENTNYNLNDFNIHSVNILPWDQDLLVKISLRHTF
jgi:hypothetical protein